MLKGLIVVMIFAFGAVMMNEGLFGAAITLICTIIAGLVAFNFYEPVAGLLEGQIAFLVGYGDIIAMLGIFAAVVTALRLLSEQVAPTMVEFPDVIHRGGGLAIGGFTGWIFSGIMICALQTLPLSQNFLGFQFDAGVRPTDAQVGNGAWNVDRRWLSYVHRVSGKVLDRSPPQYFDPGGSWALNYNNRRGGIAVQAAARGGGRPVGRPRGGGRGRGARRRGPG